MNMSLTGFSDRQDSRVVQLDQLSEETRGEGQEERRGDQRRGEGTRGEGRRPEDRRGEGTRGEGSRGEERNASTVW